MLATDTFSRLASNSMRFHIKKFQQISELSILNLLSLNAIFSAHAEWKRKTKEVIYSAIWSQEKAFVELEEAAYTRWQIAQRIL